MNEENEEKGLSNQSESHYFEAHGLTWSYADTSMNQPSGVTSYVRSTLVKKKNKNV